VDRYSLKIPVQPYVLNEECVEFKTEIRSDISVHALESDSKNLQVFFIGIVNSLGRILQIFNITREGL